MFAFQETELTPEQRSMVDTVLKSSSLLATLIHDVLDLAHLDDGSLLLDQRNFNLQALFREVRGRSRFVESSTLSLLWMSIRLSAGQLDAFEPVKAPRNVRPSFHFISFHAAIQIGGYDSRQLLLESVILSLFQLDAAKPVASVPPSP